MDNIVHTYQEPDLSLMIAFVRQIKIHKHLLCEHEIFGWLQPSLYGIRLQDFAFDHLIM